MNTENNHTDDFKKLFENSHQSEPPTNMEEIIMAGVEIQKIKNKRRVPLWFSKNLVVFSLSFMLLTLLSVFQFVTDIHFPVQHDIQLLLIVTSGIFFLLWLTEIVEVALFSRFNSTL